MFWACKTVSLSPGLETKHQGMHAARCGVTVYLLALFVFEFGASRKFYHRYQKSLLTLRRRAHRYQPGWSGLERGILHLEI